MIMADPSTFPSNIFWNTDFHEISGGAHNTKNIWLVVGFREIQYLRNFE